MAFTEKFLKSKFQSKNIFWLSIGLLAPIIYTISLIATKVNLESLFLAVAPAVFVVSCAIWAFRDNYEEAAFYRDIDENSYIPSLYKWNNSQES